VTSSSEREDQTQEPLQAEDWISAAQTIRKVREATLSSTSHIALAKRAHAGLLRAHAELMIVNGEKRHRDCAVPPEFWWAEGQAALEQNWELGDFETWIRNKVRIQAFGVRFHREDVEQVCRALEKTSERPAPPLAEEHGGRPMSKLWPGWIAELSALIHEEGVPPGTGSQGSDDLIAKVADRLAGRGLEAPSRTTVQVTAKAVLRRLRAGN